MAAIGWLSIPVAATLLAALWVAWAGHRAGSSRTDVHESLETHRRFRAAMQHATEHPPPEPGTDRGGSAGGRGRAPSPGEPPASED